MYYPVINHEALKMLWILEFFKAIIDLRFILMSDDWLIYLFL